MINESVVCCGHYLTDGPARPVSYPLANLRERMLVALWFDRLRICDCWIEKRHGGSFLNPGKGQELCGYVSVESFTFCP